MAKISSNWFYSFGGSFNTEEDIIEFIFARLDTRDFEDSYIDCGGYGEPNEIVKQTADEKRDLLYEWLMSLVEDK